MKPGLRDPASLPFPLAGTSRASNSKSEGSGTACDRSAGSHGCVLSLIEQRTSGFGEALLERPGQIGPRSLRPHRDQRSGFRTVPLDSRHPAGFNAGASRRSCAGQCVVPPLNGSSVIWQPGKDV